MKPGLIIVGALGLGVLVLIGIDKVEAGLGLGWIGTNFGAYLAGRRER